MSEKLLFGRTKKILLFVTLLFGVAASGVFGQSLSAGDVAFTGFNADSPDGFAAVVFTSVSASDEIHFSSKEWNGSSFAGSGGDFTWVAPDGGISEGTVLVFSDVGDTPSVNLGSITDDANMNITVSGDIIYSYTSTDDKSAGDFTFLGTVATDVSLYNNSDGNEGTLANTDLTQAGNETILLPDNIDNAEYIGDKSGNTPSGYRTLLNDVTTEGAIDDKWDIYNGDDPAPIPPFDSQEFTIVSAPTIAFSTSTHSGDEGNTVNLTVELIQADNIDLDIDVVFLSGSSTAESADIDNYSTQTINFTGASTGASQNITITLTGSDGFEGNESAVFQLQNNSNGSIIEPETVTLTINDDDTPDIVINEFIADPGGKETNNDGNQNNTDDEFIEIVNNESADIDISNWTISDADNVQFTFPSGTVIPAENAAVIFAGGSPSGGFGGALVFTATGLSLNNSGDTITLADDEGNLINEISYNSITPGISLNRDPDGTGSDESFIDHTAIAGSSTDYTPGTRVDGTSFSSDHAIAIRGSEGWRMISSPVSGVSFNDILNEFWMQGINNSDDPSGDVTIYSWDESGGGSFTPISNMNDNLVPGKGYFVYFFEDNEFNTPGIQGGFPKIIDTDASENGTLNNVSVSAEDASGTGGIDGEEGWNLLGNPFDTDLSVTVILDELESVNSSVNGNIYVWDHEADEGNGDWVALTDGDLIAPFQAFFVRFTSAFSDNASFDKSELEANEGQEFYKNVSENFNFDLELHGDQYFDTYSLEFTEDGSTALDRFDAYKLFSLNPNSINLYSTQNNNRLQKNVLPRELESNLEIPFSFDASGRTSLTFRWGSFENIPDDWDIILVDNELNREIDLRSNDEYEFTTGADSEINDLANSSNNNSLLKTAKQDDGEPRFTLAVQPQIAGSDESEIPESVKLNPNYPNPFNPSTTVSFELTEDSEVTLSIWNMIGQKVATLVEGVVEAGTHQQTWNASNMPSGMYIARLEVSGEVFIRKMTLIK